MQKKRMLAGSLILLFTSLGTGYSAWTDAVQINNTIQTGDLRIEFVQEQTHGNNQQLRNIYPNIAGNDLNNKTEDDYFTTSFAHGPLVTSFTMGNLYPGTTVWYEAKIKNLGNIPGVLDNIAVNFAPGTSEALKRTMVVRGQMQQWRSNPNGPDQVIAAYSLPLQGTGSRGGNGNANGNSLVTLAELESYLNGLIKDNKRVLEPGDYFTFDIDDEYKAALLQEPDLAGLSFADEAPNCLWFTLPKDAGNDTARQQAEFQILFNFKQSIKE